MRRIPIAEQDRIIYEKEIRPFLPKRIFDAHAHLLQNALHPDIEVAIPLALDPLLGNVDMPYLQHWWQTLFPDAQVTGLVMGTPTKGADWRAENDFVAKNVRGSGSLMSLLTHPKMPAHELEEAIQTLQPAGLKPYLVFADREEPNAASITDMMPEEHFAAAGRHGLCVTLHVAKGRGMADPENLRDIARLVQAYPRCQFILAHCGRCFIAPNMADALEKLPRAENLWIDTSAVCDLGVFVQLFEGFDRSRILYGSDLVTPTGFRGTYVRLGLSWHICTEDMVSGLEARATFAAYENLSVLCQAARICRLSEEELQGLFYGNAARLFQRDNAPLDTP